MTTHTQTSYNAACYSLLAVANDGFLVTLRGLACWTGTEETAVSQAYTVVPADGAKDVIVWLVQNTGTKALSFQVDMIDSAETAVRFDRTSLDLIYVALVLQVPASAGSFADVTVDLFRIEYHSGLDTRRATMARMGGGEVS